MPSQLLALTWDAQNPRELARFWATLLDRHAVEVAGGTLVPGDDTQLGLRFVSSRREKAGPNRMHLHLASTSPAHQQQTVTDALRIGARHLDVGQRPEEGHVVLADPGGNEFCVIEPGNAYLGGCGFLAELACDGTREVGLFWRDALNWPLVWDQDQETAIQSPRGGTKIAWGGPPMAPKKARNPQRFQLASADANSDAEVDRLTSLGAVRLQDDETGAAVLADPDGNEFHLTSG